METMSVVEELDRRFGIPGVARIWEGNGGLARIQITGSRSEGEMYLHGAQVTSWKPAGNDEVLFLSTKSRWQEGQAIRGGIPICFPWFRTKADDPKAPAHGFVRTRSWQLESIVEDKSGVCVSMAIESDEQTRRWWPADFRLVHRVVFGPELTLETRLHQYRQNPFAVRRGPAHIQPSRRCCESAVEGSGYSTFPGQHRFERGKGAAR